MNVAGLRKHAEALRFSPQDAVRWLAPAELWRTAVKVALSSVFASYADKREIQAALPAELLTAPGAEKLDGELWLDFVADIGDGFDATYTVASLLAADELEVAPPAGATGAARRLPRGSVLVLGGDEVYPTASAGNYDDRMKGPYRAALPAATPAPMMVAIPGNHDWYDGLTAFLRVFTQGGTIGAWRTEQARSYFAVRLPQNWWLLGVDTQLGTYIDGPQLRFFQEHVSDHLRPGHGVIICSATPTWVHTGEGDVDAFNALHYFDHEVVRQRHDRDTDKIVPTGARIRLWITGDKHHYARYVEAAHDNAAGGGAARQMVTCGLGGAYLSATHDLPGTLQLPPTGSRLRQKDALAEFTLAAQEPTKERSRKLKWGMFALTRRGLPFRNPGLWWLAGGVHAAAFLLLGYLLSVTNGRVSPLTTVTTVSVEAVLELGAELLVGLAIIWLGLLVRHRARPSATLPMLGAALQLVVGLAGLLVAVAVPWPDWRDWLVALVCLVGTFFATGLVATFAFALYVCAARGGLVAGWQTAAQSIEDTKGFVRMSIGTDGNLTLYPVVVDRICRDWTIESTPTMSRPVPASGLPRPRLIEEPVVIVRDPAGTG